MSYAIAKRNFDDSLRELTMASQDLDSLVSIYKVNPSGDNFKKVVEALSNYGDAHEIHQVNISELEKARK